MKKFKTSKKTIAVFFGGKSNEHDISIITAMQTLAALDKEQYDVMPIYISNDGQFYFSKTFFDVKTFVNFSPKNKSVTPVTFLNSSPYIVFKKGAKYANQKHIDCAIICCHGAYGEDGCLQGLLEMNGIPYSSCDVACSAVCMNKKIMKQVFAQCNLPIVPYVCFSRDDAERNAINISQITYPCVVKPASCGSSIGISFCQNPDQLNEALDLASQYDQTIIVEKCVENLKEINCAVLKVGNQLYLSSLEEPTNANNILTFEDKYLTFQTKGQNLVLDETEIDLDQNIKDKIKELAARTFEAVMCDGVARIDFMIDQNTMDIYVNEINTVPGSLSNYLFRKQFNFTQLVQKLIESALEKQKNKSKNEYKYSSPAILKYLNSSQKTRKYKKL